MTDLGALVDWTDDAWMAWELAWLEERLEAWLRAAKEPSLAGGFYGLVAHQNEARGPALALRAERGAGLAMERLSLSHGLHWQQEQLLVACLAPHLSASVGRLLMQAQGNVLKPHPEADFVCALIYPRADRLTRLSAERHVVGLQAAGLLQTMPSGRESGPRALLDQALVGPDFIAQSLLGRPGLDGRLRGVATLREPTRALFDLILSPDVRRPLEEFAAGLFNTRTRQPVLDGAWVVRICGPRQCGRSLCAEALAHTVRRPLLTVELGALASHPHPEVLLETAALNARHLGAVLHLDGPERLLQGRTTLESALVTCVERAGGLTVLEVSEDAALGRLDGSVQVTIELQAPRGDERRQLWESALPAEAELAGDVNLGAISGTFELTGGQIQQAMRWALQRVLARGGGAIEQADLESGARQQLRSRLDQYARRVHVKLGLEDLVLPEDVMDEVQELLDACRHRQTVLRDWGFAQRLSTGRGVVALFVGEAGTGKTLCAEILSAELDIPIHIVSVPSVVSKWVGETERNLQDIFAQARSQHGMLLFDEADSLFATRVKVERAADHFQNMEVNLLLQEIERFEGIVILTTNLEANIDRAFQRRILFRIDFPVPGQEERAQIWRTLLPPQTPIQGALDFDMLAEDFELTGGQIKNAIVRAAYRCAAAGQGLDQERLMTSAAQQASAAGRLIRSSTEAER